MLTLVGQGIGTGIVFGKLQISGGAKIHTNDPVLLLADGLSTAEVARLDRSRVAALLMRYGTSCSHAVIYARTVGLPVIIGLGEVPLSRYEGCGVIADSAAGRVYLFPDAHTCAAMREKSRMEQAQADIWKRYRLLPTQTRSGRRVSLAANVSTLQGVDIALENGAEGIGLFRTESIYTDSQAFPTEEEQFRIYRGALERMGGRRVVVRTLDISSACQPAYFGLEPEVNPAMGMRAVRVSLYKPEIFRTQLRALYRASAYGSLAILFPMITSTGELAACKRAAAQVRQELRREGVAFAPDVALGMLIETPASAVTCDEFAAQVDFVSIGTNDLAQYTLAADRQNPYVGPACDVCHAAVLGLVDHVVRTMKRKGVRVGISGELAADARMAERFVKMGVDELSVVPTALLPLRADIMRLP